MEFNIILKWPRLSVPLNRIHTRYIVKVPRSACIHMKKKCNIISIMVIHNDRTLFFNCSRKSIKNGDHVNSTTIYSNLKVIEETTSQLKHIERG